MRWKSSTARSTTPVQWRTASIFSWAVSTRRFARSTARFSSMQAGSWSPTRRAVRACWSWRRAWFRLLVRPVQFPLPVFLAVVVNPFQDAAGLDRQVVQRAWASPRNFASPAANSGKTSIDVTRADPLMADSVLVLGLRSWRRLRPQAPRLNRPWPRLDNSHLCCKYSSMISAFRTR